ncbi:hypothetical protein PAXRUDRAFT_826389 [Paxillus rubicundulus Ve08.2h10]|uniref:Uncharacterized protein n=1 Tax=Paxillus rubicundulus Ve08.2h10 TaxID=930991 RepID=A0A0D0E4F1_9AGAM|nr:hypothetical protein PAXRUDRAFT_826389 [Paxillus rubicundulus Ve08.2h10]
MFSCSYHPLRVLGWSWSCYANTSERPYVQEPAGQSVPSSTIPGIYYRVFAVRAQDPPIRSFPLTQQTIFRFKGSRGIRMFVRFSYDTHFFVTERVPMQLSQSPV